MNDVYSVVKASQDAWAERDLERFLSYFREDVVTISVAAHREGREELRAFAVQLYELIAKIEFVDRKIFVVGNTAAQRYTLRMTLTNGKQSLVEGVDVFELDEERKIQKLTGYYERADLQAVIGG